jgi:signal transduction histidine kinase
VLAVSWVTPGDALRAAAYGLLLVIVFRRALETKRELARSATSQAVEAERERIARDLHDGLAQDLAFIATHGQRLTSELGPDHPLSVAARRALAATRGTILDLSASGAPTTAHALREVAGELAARFSVRVDVQVASHPDAADLEPSEREEVVRIVREAIANAVRHGHAHHISVALDCRGATLRLRVSDDGCGMPEAQPAATRGHGLSTMQARAESLGGQLTVRRSALGGTELEVA